MLAAAAKGVTPALVAKAQAVDDRMHATIVDALGNGIISNAYRVNSIKIRLIRQSETRLYADLVVPVMRVHLDVIAAIASRDPARAAAAMEAHIAASARPRAGRRQRQPARSAAAFGRCVHTDHRRRARRSGATTRARPRRAPPEEEGDEAMDEDGSGAGGRGGARGVALGAAAAQAQQVTIRWGDVVGGTHPSVQMIDRIAADVKAKSNGRIVIQSFPGGQLGGSRDMIDAVANGAQQIVTEGAANFGAWVPSISVVEAPYVWRDAAHLDKAMNGPIGEEFNETLVKARGMRILGTTYYGTRHITTTSKEVKSAGRHGRLQAARARERRVQGDGRGLGREAHADELRRALPGAQAERRRRPGEPAADDQVGQVRRGAEVPGAVRPHHHAAAGGRERGVLAGPRARRPQDHRRRGQGAASPGRTRS